jgi:hypothetical protein
MLALVLQDAHLLHQMVELGRRGSLLLPVGNVNLVLALVVGMHLDVLVHTVRLAALQTLRHLNLLLLNNKKQPYISHTHIACRLPATLLNPPPTPPPPIPPTALSASPARSVPSAPHINSTVPPASPPVSTVSPAPTVWFAPTASSGRPVLRTWPISKPSTSNTT